jgi:hypothetical protein
VVGVALVITGRPDEADIAFVSTHGLVLRAYELADVVKNGANSNSKYV